MPHVKEGYDAPILHLFGQKGCLFRKSGFKMFAFTYTRIKSTNAYVKLRLSQPTSMSIQSIVTKKKNTYRNLNILEMYNYYVRIKCMHLKYDLVTIMEGTSHIKNIVVTLNIMFDFFPRPSRGTFRYYLISLCVLV